MSQTRNRPLSRKEQTFQRIQDEAMRLFLDQGYEETTVEQIAAAAGVSHMTVFRHFPTKEALIFSDRFDPMMLDAIRQRPSDEPVLDSVFLALADLVKHLTPEEQELHRNRKRLSERVPALRDHMWKEMAISIDEIEGAIRARGDFDADSALPRLAAQIARAILTDAVERSAHDSELGLDALILASYADAKSLLNPA